MGDRRGVDRVLVGKLEGKRPLGRPRRRWEENIKMDLKRLRWSRSSVLAFGTQVREAVGFLRANKNPQHAFLRRGSKAVGPML